MCLCMRTVSNTFCLLMQNRWCKYSQEGNLFVANDCSQLSICRASLILCKFLTGVCHSVVNDFWFETGSEVYSVDRVNLHLDWVFINLSELRDGCWSVYVILAHWIEVYCPRCGVRTSRLWTHREYRRCCCFYDSMCREQGFDVSLAKG